MQWAKDFQQSNPPVLGAGREQFQDETSLENLHKNSYFNSNIMPTISIYATF